METAELKTVASCALSRRLGILDSVPELQLLLQHTIDVFVVPLDLDEHLGESRPIDPKINFVEIGNRQDMLELSVVIFRHGTESGGIPVCGLAAFDFYDIVTMKGHSIQTGAHPWI